MISTPGVVTQFFWCPRLETNLHGLTVALLGLSWADVPVDLVFELPRRLQVGGFARAS